MGSRLRVADALRAALPRGLSLSSETWSQRHRWIIAVLWAHSAAIPIFALVRGYSVVHAFVEASPVAIAAAAATSRRLGRQPRAIAATVGIFTSSAVLVHLSGGTIEMHFHFFVMVALVALYQDWVPFLLAIGYVLVHHGLIGALSPESVFNHAPAWAHPWRWAAIHATFIAGISAVCTVTWRLNELELERRTDAEQELRNALSVLGGTLEATADGILVVNQAGRMVRFNQRFIDMWHVPPEIAEAGDDDRAIAFVLDQLTDPERFVAKVRELYSEPDSESFDELEFKDGRFFERYSQPQRVGDEPVGRVWSFRDVTQRKRDELVLLEAMKKDREAVEKLRALDEAKSLLLTAVSHELRTPLTSVVGFAHTLLEHDGVIEPEHRRELLGRLQRNAERLQSLVLNILDLDRLQRGILEPRRMPTDVGELVRNVVDGLDFAERPIQVASERLTALLDAGMIERVVENLVANAAKHTPQGSPVVVRAGRGADPADLRLVVDDEGPGVPDDLKPRVFEPFTRGEVAEHSPGTGVGLSLVDRFAELHGGRAWVEDRPGGGARFVVLLPGCLLHDAAGPDESLLLNRPAS